MIVSRGHGKGHAMPDMAIAKRLLALDPHLRFRFVSYASGAEAYRACGYEVLDMQLPDNPPLWDMVIAMTRLIAKTTPALVVSHKEIAVVPAAKICDIPCLFITDFFMDPGNPLMLALQQAKEVIFTAQAGIFTEPPYLRTKVYYVGRAVREFTYSPADRDRARRELALPSDATVVLCQPGAWSESQVPVADLLAATWDLLPCVPKRLIWLAGRDYQLLTTRFLDQPDILMLKEDWNLDRLMVASDVLITKANRMTVYEAAAIGLPSISISNLLNWPDDVAVSCVPSNSPLSRDSTTAEVLSRIIAQKLTEKHPAASDLSAGVAGAAARIARNIESLRARPNDPMIH
jgi:UDP-N-acetylglucosamine:LPS N-acetylglucosamine transferase